ncbi:MAG: hypothetical protein JWM68_2496 [Verrucomicrobiales bacterium]|nr:hypothetical protein [Verrucomicrobiales bacterium]
MVHFPSAYAVVKAALISKCNRTDTFSVQVFQSVHHALGPGEKKRQQTVLIPALVEGKNG